MTELERAFRKLREDWFNARIYFRGHERQLETEEDVRRHERGNQEMKALYDAETERIIRSETLPLEQRRGLSRARGGGE